MRMLNHRQVWQIAFGLISKHGKDAETVARDRAVKAAEEDNQPEFTIWLAVGAATEHLLKRQPDAGEWRH
jgi:hypothetical protein